MLVGDDENNVLRLYHETQSGPPVKTFDFTSVLPYGTTEIDIEASARSGNTLYWTGSMSNNSSGDLAPARSTLFAATITGSGANTDADLRGQLHAACRATSSTGTRTTATASAPTTSA